MKVLLVGRPALAIRGGGDKVLLLKTHEYLRELGVRAEMTIDRSPTFRGFDLAHLFTLSTAPAGRAAGQRGVPYVVSPIYWDAAEANRWIVRQHPVLSRIIRDALALTPVGRWLATVRDLRDFSDPGLSGLRRGYLIARDNYRLRREEVSIRRELLRGARCLLPASETEMRHLEQRFGETYPYNIIPGGVDRSFAVESGENVIGFLGKREYVLSVSARINHRKNQLSLIRALAGTGLSLVIIASAITPSERRYERLCRRQADSSVTFLPAMPHEALAATYRSARVFAMPSLFETPGLVYLEAALGGANIVATDRGSAREYFGDLAWYCSPYDLRSIRSAVLDAYASPRSGRARDHVLRHFTWERVARMTRDAYENSLSGSYTRVLRLEQG